MTNKEIVNWLLGQCVPDGDCMIWKGALSTGKGNQAPTARHPVTGKNIPARRALLIALGKPVDGLCCTCSCGNQLCIAPKHAEAVTRKELQKRSGQKFAGNLVRSAKLADARRAQIKDLTIEDVRQMRAAGKRPKATADEYGIQLQRAAAILRGDCWREYSSPFAGLGL